MKTYFFDFIHAVGGDLTWIVSGTNLCARKHKMTPMDSNETVWYKNICLVEWVMCIDKVHREMFPERSSSKDPPEYDLGYAFKQREKEVESALMKRRAGLDESLDLIDWNTRMCAVHEELTCGTFVPNQINFISLLF